MLYTYLKRGVLAGGLAGIAYGIFMASVANPLTAYIHEVGHDHAHDHGHSHDHAGHAHEASHAVSEATTAIVSVGSGLLWAIFLGGMFGITLYLTEPALPGDRTVRAFVLAAVGFLTVSVTPWLALPPATPGAENLYGITPRLGIYVGLVVLGGLLSVAAVGIYTQLDSQHRALSVGAALLPIAAAGVLIPILAPTIVTHPELPSELVAAYQALVVLSQATLWGLIAGSYSWLARREPSSTAATFTGASESA